MNTILLQRLPHVFIIVGARSLSPPELDNTKHNTRTSLKRISAGHSGSLVNPTRLYLIKIMFNGLRIKNFVCIYSVENDGSET